MRVAWDTKQLLWDCNCPSARLLRVPQKWRQNQAQKQRQAGGARGKGKGKGRGRGKGKASDVAVVDTVTPAVQIDVNDGDLY